MMRSRSALAGACLCLLLALPGVAPAEPTSAPAPAGAIPFKQEKHGVDSQAYQSLAALVLVGLAAYGIILGLKRYKGAPGGKALRKTRRLHTVEAVRLGRRSMLYVVEYQGRELLLAEGEQGVQLLSTLPLDAQGAGDA